MTTLLERMIRAVSLLAFLAGASAAFGQDAPAASGARGNNVKLDIDVSESRYLEFDKPVDVASQPTVSNPDVLSVERVENDPNKLLVRGIQPGRVTLGFVVGTRPYTYTVTVSPPPERLYINLYESKRLVFGTDVDDITFSLNRIVRQVQPNSKTVLLEATGVGKTTATIYTKGGEIYRYFISTFEGRGADLLEIQNKFAAKGYRFLNVSIDHDQATITGTVPVQEELDDAVRIVKEYTPYVIVKATIGQPELTDYNEDEAVIINNIQRLAQVKNLVVRVRFPMAAYQEQLVTTKQTGDTIVPEQAISSAGVTTRTASTFAARDPNSSDAPLDRRPLQNVTTTVTQIKNRSYPEKIFLYGEVEDDLDEARAIRVARTYAPLVVSFITVKDPIQLRVKVRFVSITKGDITNTGILWSDSSGLLPPQVSGSFRTNYLNSRTNNTSAFNAPTVPQVTNSLFDQLLYGFSVDVRAQLQLAQTYNFARVVQETTILMQNGQVGQFFSGDSIPYVGGFTVAVNGQVLQQTVFQPVGLALTVAPLNFQRANQQPGIENLFTSGSNSSGSGGGSPLVPTLSKYFQLNSPTVITPNGTQIQQASAPIVDESAKYVDENGLIGVNVLTNISTLTALVDIGNGVQAPQVAERQLISRAQVREGQSLTLAGLFDDRLTRSVRALPWLEKIPIFGWLFRAPNNNKNDTELVMLLTPEIVRMRDEDQRRVPKPQTPELKDELIRGEILPVVKPVRYNAAQDDLAPNDDVRPKNLSAPVIVPSPMAPVPPSGLKPKPVEPSAPSRHGASSSNDDRDLPAVSLPQEKVDMPVPARRPSNNPAAAVEKKKEEARRQAMREDVRAAKAPVKTVETRKAEAASKEKAVAKKAKVQPQPEISTVRAGTPAPALRNDSEPAATPTPAAATAPATPAAPTATTPAPASAPTAIQPVDAPVLTPVSSAQPAPSTSTAAADEMIKPREEVR